MPPKRPPRRGKKHGLPGSPALAEVALKDIRRAHSLVERGDHENAAHLFERQARDAADRGIYLPAAHLFLQAGRARLLAGETSTSGLLLRKGLGILAERVNSRRLMISGNQLIEDLLSMGDGQLAVDLRGWLGQILEINPLPSISVLENLPARTKLRIRCPHCYAILRPADIESGDAGQEVCVYCGSLIDDQEMA
jgi:hypothetical protein